MSGLWNRGRQDRQVLPPFFLVFPVPKFNLTVTKVLIVTRRLILYQLFEIGKLYALEILPRPETLARGKLLLSPITLTLLPHY